MAPPNPKHPRPSTSEPAPKVAKPKSEVELPFDDGDAAPRVPKRRKMAITPSTEPATDDRPLSPSLEGEVGDPGFPAAFLYVERGPGAGQLVPVRQGVLLMGRASTSSLRLQHPSVSRRHAQLNRKGERFFVRDLASQNGTYVNQVRIDKEIEVFPGDEMVLGTAQLRLRGPNQASQTGGSKAPGPSTDEATPRQFRLSTTSPVSIAIAGGIVGFGLAAVIGFTSLRFFRGPSFEELDTSEAPAPKRAAAPTKPAHLAPTAQIVPTITSTSVAADAPLPESSKKAVAKIVKSPPKEAPKPTQALVKPTKVAARDPEAQVTAEEAAPAGPSIVAQYEAGDLDAAIQMAKKKSAKDLLTQLTRFQAAFAAAKNSLTSQDEAEAFKHLQEALKVDEQLTHGRGTYNGEVRHQLSSLNTIKGSRLIKADPAAAKRAFSAALKYDPENSEAQARLASLADATPKPAKKKDARSAIDAAFGD